MTILFCRVKWLHLQGLLHMRDLNVVGDPIGVDVSTVGHVTSIEAMDDV